MLNAMTMDWDPIILESKINLYPDELSTEIEQVNEWVYELLNNGEFDKILLKKTLWQLLSSNL